jgi:hypothetical protein
MTKLESVDFQRRGIRTGMPNDRQNLEEEHTKRHNKFEREALAYLKEHGPQPYDGFYVLFDRHRTAEIKSVLHEFRQGKLIEIGKDSHQMVSITASGLKRLKAKTS